MFLITRSVSLFLAATLISGASTLTVHADKISKSSYSVLQRSALRQLGKVASPVKSKSNGNTVVSVEWIYIDESRATVLYKVSGVAIPDGFQLLCAVQTDSISIAGAAPVNDLAGLMNHCQRQPDGSYTIRRTLPVSGVRRSQNARIALDVTVGGLVPIFKMDPKLPDPPAISESKFHFDLDALVSSGLTVDVMPQARGKNILFTPKQLRFSKGFADADVCITLPDAGDWTPTPVLAIGGKLYEGSWYIPNFRDPRTLSTPTRCYVFEFELSADLGTAVNSSKIGLRVDRLDLRAAEESAAQGILRSVSPGWNVDVPIVDPTSTQ